MLGGDVNSWKYRRYLIKEAILISLYFLSIIYFGHFIAEYQKITICQSCQEQNWTGELPAVDMKVNCSEVRDWCEEKVMVERDEGLKFPIFDFLYKK